MRQVKGDEQRIRPIEVQLTAVEANRADIVTKDTVYTGQLIVCYSAIGQKATDSLPHN